MKAIINATVLLPTGEVTGKALLFERVCLGLTEQPPAGAELIDARGLYAAPGFIDVHIHGYLGEDASDGSAAGLRRMAAGILKNGVTAFLPTTMTVSWPQLEAAFAAIRACMREDTGGAQVLGCHAEGPFINPARKGAQAAEAILPPDAARFLPYADTVRLVTLAPEMPGALDCIRALRAAGVRVSVGHTDADYETARAAVAAGATEFTHTFNAMSALGHRSPGAAGAALTGEAYCELIADTFHVHPALFSLLHRCKGDRLLLITDCTRAGGLSDGEYDLGGQTITVRGIECRLADGTIAGSVLKMNDAVRNLRDRAGLPFHEAVNCASLHPACALGLEKRKGSLQTGRDADILLLDEACAVHAAWVRGERRL